MKTPVDREGLVALIGNTLNPHNGAPTATAMLLEAIEAAGLAIVSPEQMKEWLMANLH